MDELEAIKVTFFQECEELLADLEGGLLAMQEGVGDIETVNAVFRAVHSIKGGAGADWSSYEDAAGGVTVDRTKTTAQDTIGVLVVVPVAVNSLNRDSSSVGVASRLASISLVPDCSCHVADARPAASVGFTSGVTVAELLLGAKYTV